MLRDGPRIFGLLFVMAAVFMFFTMWHKIYFAHESDTLNLNDIALVEMTNNADNAARVYPGVFMLVPAYEQNVWERLEESYPDGTRVQFDYSLGVDLPDETKQDYASKLEENGLSPLDVSDDVVSHVSGSGDDPLMIGDVSPNKSWFQDHVYNRPVRAVRIRVHKPDDDVGKWTHTATVEADVASADDT